MVAYDENAKYSDTEAKQVEVYMCPVSCPKGHEVGVREIYAEAEGWCHCGEPLKKGRKHKVKIGK